VKRLYIITLLFAFMNIASAQIQSGVNDIPWGTSMDEVLGRQDDLQKGNLWKAEGDTVFYRNYEFAGERIQRSWLVFTDGKLNEWIVSLPSGSIDWETWSEKIAALFGEPISSTHATHYWALPDKSNVKVSISLIEKRLREYRLTIQYCPLADCRWINQ
jgi:hypothetical protein